MSTGVYVRQKANSDRPPKLYWVVREAIPRSESATGKQTYKDHFPPSNSERSAQRLAKIIAAGRPAYERGRPRGYKYPKKK